MKLASCICLDLFAFAEFQERMPGKGKVGARPLIERQRSKKQLSPQKSKKTIAPVVPPKRFKNKEEADSSNHRLSRVKPIDVNAENGQSWASTYFAAHPEERVSSPPEDRLEQVKQDLEGELEDNELVQKLALYEALTGIVYGEDSVEYGDARFRLGTFYSRRNRFPSAVRHLDTAQRLLDGEAKVAAGIELAYANAMCGKFADHTKLLEAAVDIDDGELKGRGWFAQGLWQKSTRHTDDAADSIQEAIGSLSDDSPEAAQWREELARILLAMGPSKAAQARDVLGEAAEIWGRLGQTRKQRAAEKRRDRINVPEDEDEDDFETDEKDEDGGGDDGDAPAATE